MTGLCDYLPAMMACVTTAYTQQHPERHLKVSRARPDRSTSINSDNQQQLWEKLFLSGTCRLILSYSEQIVAMVISHDDISRSLILVLNGDWELCRHTQTSLVLTLNYNHHLIILINAWVFVVDVCCDSNLQH